jgi:uncharacterized protein YihD (DUF1040 family)
LDYVSGFPNFDENKIMSRVDTIRNSIIEKLLAINNKDYLNALYKLVDNSSFDQDAVELTDEQVLMLQMSDNDITHKRLISQEELDKQDLQWLKGK